LGKPRPTKVYARLKIFLASFYKASDRNISCWDSQLDVSARRFEGVDKKNDTGGLTILLPLPKPLMTGPLNFNGKGCSGPESGLEGPSLPIFNFDEVWAVHPLQIG